MTTVKYVPKKPPSRCWAKDTATTAPLYAPAVEPLDFEKLVEKMQEELRGHPNTIEALRWAKQWLNQERAPVTVSGCPVSKFEPHELAQMTTNALIRPTTGFTGNTHAYPTIEWKKDAYRKRVINNTFGENASRITASYTRPVHRIAPVTRMIARLCSRGRRFAASRDFKSFYHQFMVKANRFTFTAKDGRAYSLLRMAMGHTDAAMVAHATTTAIVQLAIQRASALYPTATFAYDVIIDDASWSSCNEEACREVERQFDAICSDFNVTIGSKTPTSGLLAHRGVIVDLRAQSVKLRQSFIDKHKTRRDLLSRSPTFARCRSALGTLVYYATISPTIREQIPDLLRIVARVARTTTKQAIAAASERLVTAMDVMVQNHEWHTTDVDATPFGGYVFSDATPTSWGGIYVDLLGEVTFAKGRFENPMKIHLAEATAMIQTTKQLVPKTSYQRKILFATDNTTWLHTIPKMWSTNDELQDRRLEFHRLLRDLGVTAWVFFVPSAAMPADELSRDNDIDREKLQQAVRLAQATWGEICGSEESEMEGDGGGEGFRRERAPLKGKTQLKGS
jgi:hypothetical protein